MRPDSQPTQTIRLADYRPPSWQIDRVHLTFDLSPGATRVRAEIAFRQTSSVREDLVLDGRNLSLVACAVDGADMMDRVTVSHDALRLPAGAIPTETFLWTAETEISPETNTELEGLYLSRGMYCTQCEAEGFRKITYYPDRPDVMAPFTVRIEAPVDVPVLLSNGNPGETGALPDNRHFAEWHDPHPKPAYLFALVAGDLVSHYDDFTTASGAPVALRLWVRPGDQEKCAYAMDALKRSMEWDERAYGLEYDLDIFQIVAVDDFNMGAMENKGLNVFNSKYVLASPETATDRDYELIESIVAHEYFHNWTGNRITCRDWFQLCLKEGLTVFRDQQFSADERSAPVQRIGDVKQLRARQFREDAGPLAHPVRPEAYQEINNFYTATVYEKGAEVIRMLHTLVGAEGYRRALDLYFERHDGQACTIEQFRTCFEDACKIDLSQFALWWRQAGTPTVTATEHWADETYTLTLSQTVPPTPGQPDKAPMVIPVATGLIGPDGTELAPTRVLELTEDSQTFEWHGLSARPTPSINRGFSAPVVLDRSTSAAEQALLLAHDTDPFNRWEAGHDRALGIARDLIDGGQAIPEDWTDALGAVLSNDSLDPDFRALLLDLPGEDELAGDCARRGVPADPDAIHRAARSMRETVGTRLSAPLTAVYDALASDEAYSPDAGQAGRRTLRNRCLALMMASGADAAEWAAEAQYDHATSMTDRMAALAVLCHAEAPGAASRLAAFYDDWAADSLVIDKWFTVQATVPGAGALDAVIALTDHPAFDWKTPNRFRSLVGAFAMANPAGFHRADGAGYRFLADWLIRLDPLNPQTTARMASAFETWARYTPDRQALMKAELQRVAAQDGLSRNTSEMVERMLNT